MKRVLFIAVPVLILALLIGWRVQQNRSEASALAAQRAARTHMPAVVTLASVEVRDLAQVFDVTGSVEAPLAVKIAPKITGRIETLTVREGDRVRKGQVLARIDDTEIEATVQQQAAALAEAQYRLAQARMNQNPADVAVNTQIRQQQAALASANADYTQSVESSKAEVAAAGAAVVDASCQVDNARAAVRAAQANLKNAKTRHNRVKELFGKGFIAAQEVDDAEASLGVHESAVEIAEGQLQSANAQRDAADQRLKIVQSRSSADIEAARAKLEQTKASLEYATASTSQKSAYRQSIEALKASVTAADASLRSAKARRQDTVLVSPLDGFVTGRYSDPGAIASPTQPIIAVQFLKQVWVSASVPEEVCAVLHIGQPASLRFDAFPGREFDASIIQINPSADPQSRQFKVRVILSNEGNLLKPGMYAHVSLETDRVPKAVVVPRESVQRDTDGAYVVIADKDNTAKRVRVSPGFEDDRYVSVGDAVQPGQKVVSMSAMPIKDGQKMIARDEAGNGGKPAGATGGRL